MSTQQQGTSRRLVVCGFILSSLFTVGLNYLVSANLQIKTDRRTQLEQFQAPGNQMDALVTAFMDKYLSKESTEAERKALRTNIQMQWNAIEQITPLLEPNEIKTAHRYQEEIVLISEALDSLPAPEDAQALMQAIANARDTRVDVSAAVQRRGRTWF